jgi:hypothetical protein
MARGGAGGEGPGCLCILDDLRMQSTFPLPDQAQLTAPHALLVGEGFDAGKLLSF